MFPRELDRQILPAPAVNGQEIPVVRRESGNLSLTKRSLDTWAHMRGRKGSNSEITSWLKRMKPLPMPPSRPRLPWRRPPEEKKGGGKKLIIIGAAALVLLAGGGGGAAYMLGYFDPPAAGVVETEEVVPDPVFFDLPEITVNLASSSNRRAYMKVQISLEVADKGTVKRIKPYLPRVMDTFQVYLREMRTTDLDGSAGLFRLKEELQRRVNVAIYPARVEGVLFKEILIQ